MAGEAFGILVKVPEEKLDVCFVAMPFHGFDDLFNNIIAPAANGVGLIPIRTDRAPRLNFQQDIVHYPRGEDVCGGV